MATNVPISLHVLYSIYRTNVESGVTFK